MFLFIQLRLQNYLASWPCIFLYHLELLDMLTMYLFVWFRTTWQVDQTPILFTNGKSSLCRGRGKDGENAAVWHTLLTWNLQIWRMNCWLFMFNMFKQSTSWFLFNWQTNYPANWLEPISQMGYNWPFRIKYTCNALSLKRQMSYCLSKVVIYFKEDLNFDMFCEKIN